ncbi:MAG: hypothetical protein AAFO07_03455 [Bacteroidota bacterium]
MPKQKTDDLIQLIRSLSRAEKRHFRLFVRRNQASDDILFLQLFDFLDKYKEYDENMILKKLPGIKKRQLSNLKAHLYKQLLISLRLLSTNHINDIQIRELIDFSKVLYDKGLYRQSLDVLEKAKQRSKVGEYLALNMEILDFEKHIESQYITRSIAGRAEQLTEETEVVSKALNSFNSFSNLSLQLYSLYLKVGYARSERDFYYVKEFFFSKLPNIAYQELGFLGKLYYCQSFIWYYYITQEFTMCYRYAQKWIDLYDKQPEYIQIHPALYLKGLHNLLNALFNVWHYPKFKQVLEQLHDFPNQYDISKNINIQGLYHLYHYIHTIKLHFIQGSYDEGLKLVPQLEEIIEEDVYNWDNHRIMVFYYRIACLYFGSGDNDKAIDYLNKIINQKNPDYREDIQCFARILSLIAHFELGNMQLVEYQVKSVYRFLGKMKDLHEVQKEIVRFLRKTPRMQTSELKQEFFELKGKLEKWQDEPFERRPFLYLDIISWLESKIEGCTVKDITRKKHLEKQKILN